MNKRIKELIEQSYDPEYGFIIPEKFAELLVRECIKVMEEPDYGSEHDFVIVDTGERIKEHFGIRLQDIFGVEE